MGSNNSDDLAISLRKRKVKNKRGNTIKKLYPAMINTISGEVYGYIDEKGNFIIEPKFTKGYDFNDNGLAIVEENNLYGIINLLGEYITPPIYDSIGEFVEGRAIFVKGNKMGIVDECGSVLTEKLYSFIGDFHEGLAMFSTNKEDEYRYGYIDLMGKEAIPNIYEQAHDFKDGVALVKGSEGKYELINKVGILINSYSYKYLSQYGEGTLVFAEDIGGPYGYINKNGDIIIKPIYSNVNGFEDGVAIVATGDGYNGPYGLIDLNGEFIFTPIFSEIKYLGSNIVALGMPVGKSLGDEEFIAPSIFAIGDTRGNILTTFKYLNIGSFKNNIAYASDNINTFFIDKQGKGINRLPKVKWSGELLIKENIVYADIDYSPYYLTRSGRAIYKPNNIIELDSKYSVVKEKYKPNYSFLIYIPQVRGIHLKKILRKVNVKLKALSYFKPFAAEQINNSINEHEILDYSYYGTFKIEFFKSNLLVLNLIGYYYPLGAAHGLSSKITPCINLATGEFYKLSDLFKEESHWKERINKIIKDMIDNDQQYKYVYKDGFTGIKDGQDFYIDDNNLYIYFQPYDIGPYAAGFITFKIPFSKLTEVLNEDSSLYKAML